MYALDFSPVTKVPDAFFNGPVVTLTPPSRNGQYVVSDDDTIFPENDVVGEVLISLAILTTLNCQRGRTRPPHSKSLSLLIVSICHPRSVLQTSSSELLAADNECKYAVRFFKVYAANLQVDALKDFRFLIDDLLGNDFIY